MNPKQAIIAIVLLATVTLTGMSAFVVDPWEQVLVLQFGNPKKVVKTAGLHFKWPWQNIKFFDLRLLETDAPPNEMITLDKKSIIVDNYTRWKIVNPLKVYQVARTENGVASRMVDIVRSRVRVVLGQHTMHDIVSGGDLATLRTQLMQTITKNANEGVRDLGIKIVDVRIKRVALPKENLDAVFQRMKAERSRIAMEYRSEGAEAAKEIRATADKQRTIILADAYKQAEVVRGHADALTTAIYAKAYKKDPEFYSFTRSLEAYRASIKGDSHLVISPNSQFFRYFNKSAH